MQQETDLDLKTYCLRALGEWQAIDHAPYRLVNVENNVSILRPNGEFPVLKDMLEPGQSPGFDPTTLPPSLVASMKATRLTLVDVVWAVPPESNWDGPTPKHIIEFPPPQDVHDIVNIRSFTEELSNKDKILFMNMRHTYNKTVMEGLSPSAKAEYYWAVRLRNRSCSIVPGILETIPSLKKMGYKNWILPNGDRIPISAIRLGIIEVFPSNLFLVDVCRYMQTGGTIVGGEVFPTFKYLDSLNKKILASGVNPNCGACMAHYVLETTLPDGSIYVVDPTGRQFGYKGMNGTLIISEELNKYKENFPGIGGYHHHVVPPELYTQTRFKGNGPNSYIDRLKVLLLKYLERRVCSYCGQIEGSHEEPPLLNMIFSYKYEKCALLDCGRCRSVAYCGKLCQKLDWKNHKTNCAGCLS